MITTNQNLNEYNRSISGRTPFSGANSILAIYPYYHFGSWVFDDDRVGLTKEPFVAGADKFIEYVISRKGKSELAKKGFCLLFSLIPFPDFDYELDFIKHENMGTIYQVKNAADFEGIYNSNQLWLCPALNLYFQNSPSKIYVSISI